MFLLSKKMNIHAIISGIEQAHTKKSTPNIRVGQTVRVHYKIREGNKERVQVYEGLVTATKSGTSIQGSFTVRKVVSGIGVERTFPLHSPWIVKIETVKSGKVRRAKLNFVRRYAMSSKFKLKDKGKPGSIWEEVAEQAAEVAEAAKVQDEAEVVPEVVEEAPAQEPAAVAETEEVADNATDDVAEQEVGQPSGEAGSEPAAE